MSGYGVGTPYVHTFIPEAAPVLLRTMQALRGQHPLTGPPRVVDLGCGTGFGLCLQAAADPRSDCLGIDSDPSHVLTGRRLAREAGLTNVRFECSDLSDLARDPAPLGAADVIVCHGVIAWVPEEVRGAVFEIAARVLAPGGLLHLGYNAMPGWAALAPIGHLAKRFDADGRADPVMRAHRILRRLGESATGVTAVSSALARGLDEMEGKREGYLAHEHLPAHAAPIWHDELARRLAPLGLSYAGSARLPDNYDRLCIPPELHETLREAEAEGWGETYRDLAVNRSFRADVFARGLAPMSRPEKARALAGLTVLADPADGEPAEIVTSGGRVHLPEAAPRLIDLVRSEPVTVAEAVARAASSGLDPGAARRALILLVAGGLAKPVLDPDPSEEAIESAGRFNRVVLERALPAFASPLLGTGVRMSPEAREAARAGEAEGRVRRLVPGLP